MGNPRSDLLCGGSVAVMVLLTGAVVWFLVNYRRRGGVRSAPTGQLYWLTAVATFVPPTIALGFLFRTGDDASGARAPATEGATQIRVHARKWSWEFEYPSGERFPGELTLEKGRTYTLILNSEDVAHSFFIPEFRIRGQIVPGRDSFVRFTPTVVGSAQVLCTEFCGTSHSGMVASVRIVEPDEYRRLEETTCKLPSLPWGEKMFVKNGCPICHGVGGSGLIAGAESPGPRLVGIHGTLRPLTTGASVVADERYLRESILRPNAQVVAGFVTLQMPAYALRDDQLDAIVAYVAALK